MDNNGIIVIRTRNMENTCFAVPDSGGEIHK